MRIKTNYKRRNSMNCLKNLMKRQKKPRGIWCKRWAFLLPFLALATTSIGALGASKNPIDYLKVIFSITFCLGIFFVLMLNHVFPQKEIVTEDTRTEDGKEKVEYLVQ
ncbi:hypothetical protein NXX78_21455 [Bacteroides fragilis]|nr:hypothetical protein [Bacteroides fragilis]